MKGSGLMLFRKVIRPRPSSASNVPYMISTLHSVRRRCRPDTKIHHGAALFKGICKIFRIRLAATILGDRHTEIARIHLIQTMIS